MALQPLIWNRQPEAPCGGDSGGKTFDWNGAGVVVEDGTPHGDRIAQVYACDHSDGQGYRASISLHPVHCDSLDEAEAVAQFLAHRIERVRTAALAFIRSQRRNGKGQNRVSDAESTQGDASTQAPSESV